MVYCVKLIPVCGNGVVSLVTVLGTVVFTTVFVTGTSLACTFTVIVLVAKTAFAFSKFNKLTVMV